MNETKTHENGSKTVTNPDSESKTYNRGGQLVEQTSHDRAAYLGKQITVTRDGSGKEINRQDGWGK
ncbi:hypothetical protein GW937_00540 [Candidatus Kaiserbacteria bacterium]|nr:hypothetical protein [Candidatus Kaiserbacteria bacterium]